MKRLLPSDPLWRFVLATLLWLPLFFTFWYLLAPVLLSPLVYLFKGVFAVIYPDLISQIGIDGVNVHVITSLTVNDPSGRTGNVAMDLNALKYAYSLPLLMALLFAAQERDFSSTRMIVCYLLLLPFQLWGLVFEFLMNLAFRVGPVIPEQLGLDGDIRHFVALAYQMGVLMLPAISAASIWVALNRRFILSLFPAHRQA